MFLFKHCERLRDEFVLCCGRGAGDLDNTQNVGSNLCVVIEG